jgi:hypothetical protein
MSNCDACGTHAPLANVTFRQNTGMLVMRQSRTYEGDMCKSCARSYFWKATVHTMFLGWWGTISFILTPIFIATNIANCFKTVGLDGKAQPNALEPHRIAPVNQGMPVNPSESSSFTQKPMN